MTQKTGRTKRNTRVKRPLLVVKVGIRMTEPEFLSAMAEAQRKGQSLGSWIRTAMREFQALDHGKTNA